MNILFHGKTVLIYNHKANQMIQFCHRARTTDLHEPVINDDLFCFVYTLTVNIWSDFQKSQYYIFSSSRNASPFEDSQKAWHVLKGQIRKNSDWQMESSFCLPDPCLVWTMSQYKGHSEKQPRGISGF